MTLQHRRKVRTLEDYGVLTKGEEPPNASTKVFHYEGGGSLAPVPDGPEANGNTTTAPPDKPLSDDIRIYDINEIIEYNSYKRKDGLYKEKGPQSKNWCFTNFALDDIQFYDDPNIGFIAYGQETCPTTLKLHHQGFLQLRAKKTLGWIKNNLSKTVRFAIMKGNFKQNVEYCSKEGKLIKRGEYTGQGQNTPLLEAVKNIKENKFDFDNDENAVILLKYNKGVQHLINYHKDKEDKKLNKLDFESMFACLNHRQSYWLKLLNQQSRRQILWIHDITGNLGKSFFSDYLCIFENAFEAENAANKDLAYAYKGQKYVVFDFERSNADVINYGVIEKLKNGKIFSAKYESCSKRFVPPKVICLSNFAPNIKMFSLDRWYILSYRDGHLIKIRNGDYVMHIDDDSDYSEHYPSDNDAAAEVECLEE
nr:putative replication associated protein [Crucivirus sp.]